MAGSSPVLLYVKVEGEPTDRDDTHLAANYLVEIDRTVDPAAYGNAALDTFHSHVSVGMIEDFAFRVFDGAGTEFFNNGKDKQYAYKDRGSLAGTADYLPFEAPTPGL